MIDAATYNSIPGSEHFNQPTDPGIFSPTQPIGLRADPLTAADIATQNIMFNTTKRRYNECQGVEVALLNQISEAIEDNYLQPLRNSTTGMITSTIPEILLFSELRTVNYHHPS